MIKKEWMLLQGVYKISICEHIYVGSSVNIYNSLTQNSKELVILNGVTHDIFREVNIDTTKKIEKFLI